MKITILTYGSLGDVLPYISLALGLMDRKHEITLAAPENFEQLVKDNGIRYMPLNGNSQAILESEQGQKWMAAGDTKSFFKELGLLFYNVRKELQKDSLAACQDADGIIVGTLMINYGTTLSEKLNLPFLCAIVNPVNVSTTAFPHFIVAYKSLPVGFLNALTYKLAFKTYSKQTAGQINIWRESMGLPASTVVVHDQVKKLKTPVIHGYSPNLLPKPNDWEKHISVTGVWKRKDGDKQSSLPPEEFVRWIQSGSAPIYFGFGSMPILNPAEIQTMVSEICEETGMRAIINAGWSDFSGKKNEPGSSLYFIKQTDLEWLFPQCSVIVHHGGVGTTHVSLESGVPTIICSIFADNPLWGERLERLKIGKHIRFRNIDKNKLIHAIKYLQNEEIRKRAKLIGSKVREENGLKTALDLIEKYLPDAPVYHSRADV